MPVDISILVVGYNSQAFIIRALGSVAQAARRHTYKILFVDNGGDACSELVTDNFPDAAVVPGEGNIGFGAANNRLSELATGKWLLLLNPDTQLQPGAIDVLLDRADANRSFGILGGLSLDAAGEPLAMSRLQFPTLGTITRAIFGFAPPALPAQEEAGLLDVDAVSGGFMLISREAWDRLDGFDERFFLYAEELDLCRRYRDLGGRVGLVPAARIFHDVGSGNPRAPARIRYAMLGIATYYRKHFSPGYALACVVAHWLHCAVRFIAGTALSPFSERFSTLAASMRDVTLKPWSWHKGYPMPGGIGQSG